MSDSAESTQPTTPPERPAPEIYTTTSIHAILDPGQRFDTEADLVGATVYLRVRTPRRGGTTTISGARADVARAVEDMARALAALPAGGDPS